MADHFAAFSFVDVITEFVPGTSAQGMFAVPDDVPPLPSCLVAEAVGQLAAWVAMAHVEFRSRPVAALANETLLVGDVAPGRTLVLNVAIEQCDDDAVAYAGSASVDGTTVITLNDCLGPMLPLGDFDSPDVMRERFELLRGRGAPTGRFRGVPLPDMIVGETTVEGKSVTATLHVPQSAPFFADHFPRRPVFPATLLLDAEIRLALHLVASALPGDERMLVPNRMTHVKMRSFIAPGDVIELQAEKAPRVAKAERIMLSARRGGKSIATARLELDYERSA